MPRKSFDQWMKEVDAALVAKCYLTSADLPDVSYRDWYDDGCSPKNAAARALRYAQSES